jgi:hypothetical protein
LALLFFSLLNSLSLIISAIQQCATVIHSFFYKIIINFKIYYKVFNAIIKGGFNTSNAIRIIAAGLLLVLISGTALADNAAIMELGSKAAKMAMEEIQFEKGDENVLALTNAGHAIVDGETSQAAIKGMTMQSGNRPPLFIIGCSSFPKSELRHFL